MPIHLTFRCERRNLLYRISSWHKYGFLYTATVIFLRVKISCFHAKVTWYFIGVYIINFIYFCIFNVMRYLFPAEGKGQPS